jgi:cold shock CspA family protein
MQGRVKFFLPEGHYGFIEILDGVASVGEWYFHDSELIAGPVKNRDEVEFFLDDSRFRPGLVAVEVCRLEPRDIEVPETPVYQKA